MVEKEKKEGKGNFIKKLLNARVQNKEVLRQPKRLTVNLNSPVEPTEYHSIYFNPTYQVEKRRLFFS